jgi:hypothetical protein
MTLDLPGVTQFSRSLFEPVNLWKGKGNVENCILVFIAPYMVEKAVVAGKNQISCLLWATVSAYPIKNPFSDMEMVHLEKGVGHICFAGYLRSPTKFFSFLCKGKAEQFPKAVSLKMRES